MRFGIFYEHQLPRPWAPGDEQQLLTDALEQVDLADRLGIDYLWEVEHHLQKWKFPPTSSEPACRCRTSRISDRSHELKRLLDARPSSLAVDVPLNTGCGREDLGEEDVVAVAAQAGKQ